MSNIDFWKITLMCHFMYAIVRMHMYVLEVDLDR
jgi:hypothetical protein